ncbi:MAG: phosphate/phosphite/phosphonate ABC transporter substrate-binding protein [Pseudomonadota bacterium]
MNTFTSRTRRSFAVAALGLAAFMAAGTASAADKLRFVTGPFRATEAETRAAWEPLVKYLGQQTGTEAELTVYDTWNKVNDAMAKNEFDAAWMGGAGRYVVVRANGGGPAIATVKFAGSPAYRSIVIQREGLDVKDFPRDAKGMTINFTHENSTTGWLMAYAALLGQGINPKTWFNYKAVNQHPDNEYAVAKGESDLAVDSDANRTSMINRKLVEAPKVRIVWQSDAVPQDPISVRVGLDPALTKRLQDALVGIDDAKVKSIPMPANYTGFVSATDDDYRKVHDASVAVGRIRKP